MDSTELHNAQQMLSATNHKLSMALEVANIVPWKWNLKDHTILCDLNRPIAMAAMPGSISEDQLSVSDEQYFAKIIKEDRPRVIQAYRDLADGKIEKVKEEYRVLANDGTQWKIDWIEAQAAVESKDENGMPLTLVGSSLVITERKKMEDELLSAKDRAEESNRLLPSKPATEAMLTTAPCFLRAIQRVASCVSSMVPKKLVANSSRISARGVS